MKASWVLAGAALLALAVTASAQEAAEGTVEKPVVVMKTSLGEMHVELDPEKAPITVENFLKHVDKGFYKGTIFHRVMSTFMIQGGGFTPDLKKKTTPFPAIKLESRNGLKNKKYTLAMARTSDPNSATSQFFINVVDNGRLDFPNPDGNGYAVFGQVIKGMEVVDAIKAVKVAPKGPVHQHVPLEPIIISSVTRLEGGTSDAASEAAESKPAETKPAEVKDEAASEEESGK